MPLLASRLLVIYVVMGLLQSLFGLSLGSSPSVDTIEFARLAAAPIVEEFGLRISIIGQSLRSLLQSSSDRIELGFEAHNI